LTDERLKALLLDSYRQNDALYTRMRQLELENARLKELTELQFEALAMCYGDTGI